MADSRKPKSEKKDADLLALIGRGVVPPILHDPARRLELGLPDDETTPGRYMVELNILYQGGLRQASKAFLKLCVEVLGEDFAESRAPVGISKSYFQVTLSVQDWRKLLIRDDI